MGSQVLLKNHEGGARFMTPRASTMHAITAKIADDVARDMQGWTPNALAPVIDWSRRFCREVSMGAANAVLRENCAEGVTQARYQW